MSGLSGSEVMWSPDEEAPLPIRKTEFKRDPNFEVLGVKGVEPETLATASPK